MGGGMAQVLRSAFSAPIDNQVLEYVASIDADAHLLGCDVRGSLAHAGMLEAVGVLSVDQHARIASGLQQILAEGLELELEHEDVHMAVEKRLESLIGDDARLLHTARSRNDQVATDLRLFVDERQRAIREAIGALCGALADKAAANADAVMPGYTHLQRAQPVLFAHVLLSFREALVRDAGRFSLPLVSPLGAGALAGTAVPIDPAISAGLLGASRVFQNSIDAVSDRDFAAEFLFACALTATHLSQLAENVILWSTSEFGFVSLPDALTTGSSLMPQKKNPDCMELVRGRTGQAIGELVNILATLKALPFGYNRDLQETKPPVIRIAASILDSVAVCTLAISQLEIHAHTMLDAASDEALYATDIVERLVARGVPFRDAHERVGSVVREGRPFSELSDADWVEHGIDPNLAAQLTPEGSVASRTSHGGTAPVRVHARLGDIRRSRT